MKIKFILFCPEKRISLFLLGFFSLFLFQMSFAADPQTDATAPEETEPIAIEQRTTDYEYQVENREDPFAPFVTGPSQTNPVTPDEIMRESRFLTN